MRFNELNDSDIEYIRKIYFDTSIKWEDRMTQLATFIGKSRRTVSNWLKQLNMTETSEVKSEQFEEAKSKQLDKTKKRFIITWAQNNTPVHKKFLANIEAYADFINAEISVIAGRYRNPTSLVQSRSIKESWKDELLPYLDANRHYIHKFVSIMADIKIQPTATNPMTGLRGMSGLNSCIIGSPKVHMEVVPVLDSSRPKIMMTTGAVTNKNYTDSTSGKKGEFHHTFGFVIVEIDGDDRFYARQITANTNGDFTDLFYKVKDRQIIPNNKIEAIILGDVHVGDTDPVVLRTTTELMSKLKPKYTVLHDLFNGSSINHHEADNPIIQYRKEITNANSLKTEIDNMLEWIDSMKQYNLVVVRSNHDDFLDRWILKADWKKDVKNSLEYMTYTKLLLENKAPKGLIPYIIDQKFPDVKTLGIDESFKVKNWELGAHGDLGSNGSRSSILQYRQLSSKIIVGHYHSPQRKDGALSVGTSTKLRIGYNKGASSWMNSHVIIHEDGKAQHINIIDGKYTTLDVI